MKCTARLLHQQITPSAYSSAAMQDMQGRKQGSEVAVSKLEVSQASPQVIPVVSVPVVSVPQPASPISLICLMLVNSDLE